MPTIISVIIALIINFATPALPKNVKSLNIKSRKNVGFPFYYSKEEELTDQQINYRIKIIYLSCFMYIRVSLSVNSVSSQSLIGVPFSPIIEKLVTREEKSPPNYKISSEFSETLIKLLFIWTISGNYKKTEGFQPQQFGGRIDYNARSRVKLQKNPADYNNFGNRREGSNSESWKKRSTREIMAHDGTKCKLTDRSASHLTSKHGHDLGINDKLPTPATQKVSQHPRQHTRINNENKKMFGDVLEKILHDPETVVFEDVTIRGTMSHGYFTKKYGGENGFFVGLNTEGEFNGEIIKSQPISPKQLATLEEFNKID